MFTRILIANRGEIALRIIRACKELGIESVVVFSKEDEKSLPVLFADEAICIGPREPAESYLNVPRIISAAEVAGADAIHPGYGFLAENEQFAEVCRSSGVEFIGPSHEVMRKLGNKLEARNTLSGAGIPVVPGSATVIKDKKEAKKVISEIGYPAILKATMGGGGRGMRVIWKKEDLDSLFGLAQQEAKVAFGNSDLYIEKYIPRARHIEFQIIADRFGEIVHFGERNCSIQRRYQKLIEESPSTFIDQKKRDEMGKVAIKVAKELGYTGAGTVEFLVDEENNFYFMEMNTRLQVEHPVTEMVTGRDLVKDQIRVAGGEPLGYNQRDIKMNGVAIECRINAEDPEKNFAPSPGKVTAFHLPGGPGIRVDTHVFAGYTISSSYDSLVAKLISWGIDRFEAILRMKRALEEFVIEGVKTIIPLHQKIIEHEAFIKGEFYTDFIEREIMKKSQY
ncbi:acetyl-CoA carboxylase biotin carboxylase subunit [Candidatus Aerophobetes bacterium]|uniref:Biotin carboxylase n=1 Tax=Aerophobetes bacterium TaxID=2030807 RepID=A0A662DLY6_UNCAE|nr:MAG: acetyl-CoA carboxylase biotin carboxylase subunit [Candidatus Aerophobetes bacterium]